MEFLLQNMLQTDAGMFSLQQDVMSMDLDGINYKPLLWYAIVLFQTKLKLDLEEDTYLKYK